MGVHDYECFGCGTPATYECGAETNTACRQVGIGEDVAHLHLHSFARPGSPQDEACFRARRDQALEQRWLQAGYDWAEWEFRPSLNYRGLLFERDDGWAVWKLNDVPGGTDNAELRNVDEENPIELAVSPARTVWIVNYCPDCFALSRGEEPPERCCRYLETVRERHALPPFPSGLSAPGRREFLQQRIDWL